MILETGVEDPVEMDEIKVKWFDPEEKDVIVIETGEGSTKEEIHVKEEDFEDFYLSLVEFTFRSSWRGRRNE